jgi:hypothetical protein
MASIRAHVAVDTVQPGYVMRGIDGILHFIFVAIVADNGGAISQYRGLRMRFMTGDAFQTNLAMFAGLYLPRYIQSEDVCVTHHTGDIFILNSVFGFRMSTATLAQFMANQAADIVAPMFASSPGGISNRMALHTAICVLAGAKGESGCGWEKKG